MRVPSLPVSVPVSVPVAVLVAVPVAVPVALPGALPVAVPVAVPVDVPVAMPVAVPVAVPAAVPIPMPVPLLIAAETRRLPVCHAFPAPTAWLGPARKAHAGSSASAASSAAWVTSVSCLPAAAPPELAGKIEEGSALVVATSDGCLQLWRAHTPAGGTRVEFSFAEEAYALDAVVCVCVRACS
jgi:hypothetical protein